MNKRHLFEDLFQFLFTNIVRNVGHIHCSFVVSNSLLRVGGGGEGRVEEKEEEEEQE